MDSALEFFLDLNADSLVVARFSARIRRRSDLPAGSIKDVQRNPMIRELAAELTAAASTDAVPGAVELPIAAATEAPLLLLIGVLGVVLVEMLHLDAMLDPGPVALTGGWFYRDVAVV
jgi:hypothetical protein